MDGLHRREGSDAEGDAGHPDRQQPRAHHAGGQGQGREDRQELRLLRLHRAERQDLHRPHRQRADRRLCQDRADQSRPVGQGEGSRGRRRERARGAGAGRARRGGRRHRLFHRRRGGEECEGGRHLPGRQPPAGGISVRDREGPGQRRHQGVLRVPHRSRRPRRSTPSTASWRSSLRASSAALRAAPQHDEGVYCKQEPRHPEVRAQRASKDAHRSARFRCRGWNRSRCSPSRNGRRSISA